MASPFSLSPAMRAIVLGATPARSSSAISPPLGTILSGAVVSGFSGGPTLPPVGGGIPGGGLGQSNLPTGGLSGPWVQLPDGSQVMQSQLTSAQAASLGEVGCNLLPAGTLRDVCLSLVAGYTGSSGSSSKNAAGTTTPSNTAASQSPTCQPGYTWDGQKCVATGISGAVQQVLPGGKTGTQADIYGNAVLGAFGHPAIEPAQVGVVAKNDGSTGPIYRCPRGTRLGADNLCYAKGTKGVMWKYKHHRPLITRREVTALRALEKLERTMERLAPRAGLKVTKNTVRRRKKRS